MRKNTIQFITALLISACILGTPSGKAYAQTPEDVVRVASPAVVLINAYREVPVYEIGFVRSSQGIHLIRRQAGTATRNVSSGTGFFVTSEGFLLTNKHVVEDMQATYYIYTGDAHVPAEVAYRDPDYDLAILKVRGDAYPVIALADASEAATGDDVIAIGNALGRHVDSVSAGSISGFNRSVIVDEMRGRAARLAGLIQTTAKLYPGDSGGPLLNAAGKAVGVNVATTIGKNISFAIPASIAKYVLARAGVAV